MMTENQLYPITCLKLDSRGEVLIQANYNTSLDIGALFLKCEHLGCMAKVQIGSFMRANPSKWLEIEKLVAADWYDRLVGDIDRTEAKVG